jgi:hypothetical protein
MKKKLAILIVSLSIITTLVSSSLSVKHTLVADATTTTTTTTTTVTTTTIGIDPPGW